MDTKDLVLDLNLKLVAARHAYYAEASPVMTDTEYDKLEQELKTLVLNEPDHNVEADDGRNDRALDVIEHTVGRAHGDDKNLQNRVSIIVLANMAVVSRGTLESTRAHSLVHDASLYFEFGFSILSLCKTKIGAT